MLASASPRRKELLALLGVAFEVRPVDITEKFGADVQPEITARRLAREKAEVARLIERDAPILAADTVVALGGQILGKPRNEGEAREMLRRLRGQSHDVITAVALLPPGQRAVLARHPATRVTMRGYTDDEVAASIARGDPFDKAGGYAIQDELFRPVESYDGCYCNVVGLPLWPVIEMLRKAAIPVKARTGQLLAPCATCPLAPGSGVLR